MVYTNNREGEEYLTKINRAKNNARERGEKNESVEANHHFMMEEAIKKSIKSLLKNLKIKKNE